MAAGAGGIATEVCTNGLAVLTIDRPSALNAADFAMVKTIRDTVADWSGRDDVRAIVFMGAGGRAFCSGGDVKSLYGELMADPRSALPVDLVFQEYNLIYELRQLAKPTISLLAGVTMGFGLGLAASARYRIAVEKTRLAMPENNIGIMPDVGFSFLAANVMPRGVGRLMAATGCHIIGPGGALESGLATHHVPSDRLPELTAALQSADLSGDAHAAVVGCIGDCSAAPEPGQLSGNATLVESFAAAGSLEQAVQELEAAAQETGGWAAEVLKAMRTGAPLSQAIAWRLVVDAEADVSDGFAEQSRLARALERDFTTIGRLFYRPDFCEGVRAVLVDKDFGAKWQPPSAAGVTPELLESLVGPPAAGDRRLGLLA